MRPIFAALFLCALCVPSAHVFAESANACLQCHPTRFNAAERAGVPSLTGQHPAYIVRQLDRFAKVDPEDPYRRISIAMAHQAKPLPRREWQGVADELSAMECAFFGERDLVPLRINPCASCHGARGLSGDPAIPNLAGQDLRYLFYQYQKLREPFLPDIPGIEKSSQPQRLHPVMGPLAARLTDRVVSILQYYSKLPCR